MSLNAGRKPQASYSFFFAKEEKELKKFRKKNTY